MIMDGEERQAYKEGNLARKSWHPSAKNPYPDGTKKNKAWMQGWERRPRDVISPMPTRPMWRED